RHVRPVYTSVTSDWPNEGWRASIKVRDDEARASPNRSPGTSRGDRPAEPILRGACLRFRARNLALLSLVTALTLAVVTAEAKTTKTEKPHAGTVKSHKKVGKHARHDRKTASWKRHGQQKIAPERAREIQAALI